MLQNKKKFVLKVRIEENNDEYIVYQLTQSSWNDTYQMIMIRKHSEIVKLTLTVADC